MSLIPEFELGLWNAWILVLFFNLIVNGLGKYSREDLVIKGVNLTDLHLLRKRSSHLC